ncbi:MAG: glycosyl hydrolase family 28 protein [Fimbriimonas sp.]
MSAVAYPFPADLPLSERFEVTIDGQPQFVHDCPVGSLCAFVIDGPVEVFVRPLEPAETLSVRPRSRDKVATPYDDGFRLDLDRPDRLFLDLGDGRLPLFLFADAPENRPDPADPKVRYFAAGQVHEAGRIELGEGETLYIEGGAVVRGSVYAHGDGISVRGPGLIDGRQYAHHETRLLVFDGCRDLRVEDVATVGTPSWNLVLGACERATVERVKLIGWVVCSDGIDVVGSRDVVVRDCFLRNNDDCVAIKAIDYDRASNRTDWRRDVERVLVEGCTMYNDRAGNVMEIGYETQTASIRNVTFRNLDVLAGHGEGGVFTIHNGDRATVADVLYEDIRVEHFYDKLIDFRIMSSRYSKDSERGRIENVTLRNITTVEDRYNTVSLIGGHDENHRVEGITIENFVMGSRLVSSPDDLPLYTKHASATTIR